MQMIKDKKYIKLQTVLSAYGSMVLGYSGGVDSTFLLKVAVDVLGAQSVVAVTARSETYPEEELADAKRFAKQIRATHRVIVTKELADKRFQTNPQERCYFCKYELFSKLSAIARQKKIAVVCDAANADDTADYRPGMQASKELKVKHPLLVCGITKNDIRRWSKQLGLPSWDKPSYACLASRVPYGTVITAAILQKIEKGERYLRQQGLTVVRLRYYGSIVRIEVGQKEMKRFMQPAFKRRCIRYLKKLGFVYITLDLEGFRSGSMNEVIQFDKRKSFF